MEPLIKAVGSYLWLIAFVAIVFILQKPIIKLFRKINERKANKK
jgi:hypothetical protein